MPSFFLSYFISILTLNRSNKKKGKNVLRSDSESDPSETKANSESSSSSDEAKDKEEVM